MRIHKNQLYANSRYSEILVSATSTSKNPNHSWWSRGFFCFSVYRNWSSLTFKLTICFQSWQMTSRFVTIFISYETSQQHQILLWSCFLCLWSTACTVNSLSSTAYTTGNALLLLWIPCQICTFICKHSLQKLVWIWQHPALLRCSCIIL